MEHYDPLIIDRLRDMARTSQSPSKMFQMLKLALEPETHIVTLLHYFQQAFCLTLLEVKPISAFSRNEKREIENETLLDELVMPEILKHRKDWDNP